MLQAIAMMKITLFALLASISSVVAHGEPNLQQEHAGGIFQQLHGGRWHNWGVINNGTPAGETIQLGGGMKGLSIRCHSSLIVDRGCLPLLPEIPTNGLCNLVFDRHIWQRAREQ